MRIRRFTGRTSSEAMAAVRRTLGENALLLETSDEEGQVVMTAAVDDDPAPVAAPPAPAGGLEIELRRLARGVARLEAGLATGRETSGESDAPSFVHGGGHCLRAE